MAKIMAMVIATASENSSTAKVGHLSYGWGRAVVVLVSAALAYIVIHMHLDISSSYRVGDSLPLRMNESPVIAAERNYAVGRTIQAVALATIALKRSPLSTRGLRTFALSAQERGDTELSGKAMALAGALGWRDTPTQLWLIHAFWTQGDYAAALERADALSRRNQLRDKMRALFISAAVEHSSRSALADRLLSNPDWRPYFFEGAHFLPRSKIAAYAEFMDFFVKQGGGLKMSEIEPFAATLYANEYYRWGWLRWKTIVEEGKLRTTDVFDGDFEVSALDPQRHVSLFEWRFPQSAGVSTSFGEPPDRPNNRAFHAVSEGNSKAEIAAQTLALTPDQYTLKVEALSSDSLDLGRFYWEIHCVGGRRLATIPTRNNQRLGRWVNVIARFSVPDLNCQAQHLKLFLNGDDLQPIDLWFDQVAIVKE